MHAARYEYYRFAEAFGAALFGEERGVEEFFLFCVWVGGVVGGDGDEVYVSAFWAAD